MQVVFGWRVLLPVWSLAFLALPAGAAGIEHSVSPSRQFIIYGGDARLRGAISDLAEETKSDLLSNLQAPDDWKTPIVVNLQFPQANEPEIRSSALNFSQTGAGLKLQLDLMIDADVRPLPIQRELLRAVLLERMYRAHTDIAPGTPYVEPPDWLVEGLIALTSGSGVIPPSPEASAISLAEFLRQRRDNLDSAARQMYRAYSAALVQVMRKGINGSTRLAAYVDDLYAASNDPLADLKAHFPELSATDLEKLWQATLRGSDGSQSFKLLSFAETERRLTEILQMKATGKAVRLEDLMKPKLPAAQKALLKAKAENLMILGSVSNPVLRPIINEYQQIAQLLAAGKTRGLSTRLARLQDTEKRLSHRMGEVDDYMNWYEATQVTTSSGRFGGYLRAAQQQNGEERRHDAISTYLDALELEVGN